jgi:hypothetical protein
MTKKNKAKAVSYINRLLSDAMDQSTAQAIRELVFEELPLADRAEKLYEVMGNYCPELTVDESVKD